VFIHFWGVRGSIPTPLTPQQVLSKIIAIVQRITPNDLESNEKRGKFIANLPEYLVDSTGGNTPCVELRDGDTEIVLDAGSGIRVLGKSVNLPSNKKYNLFLSHFHWDHIQGLPFFDPAYDPKSEINIYTAKSNAKDLFEAQMTSPFFPVEFSSFTKNIKFYQVEPGKEMSVGDFCVNCCEMSHPGKSISYSFEKDGQKIVYATDVELKIQDFSVTPLREKVFNNADVLIIDAQYTIPESVKKENWGHSSFCFSIDFAIFWHIKKLYLFHHEPTYDDKKLESILQTARLYARYVGHPELEIYLAKEDNEINL